MSGQPNVALERNGDGDRDDDYNDYKDDGPSGMDGNGCFLSTTIIAVQLVQLRSLPLLAAANPQLTRSKAAKIVCALVQVCPK